MTPKQAIVAMAACPFPRCRAPIGAPCRTPTGRNHVERVHAALRATLEALKKALDRPIGLV